MRALTRDDLACLKAPRAPQGRVKNFRNTHHRLAKLFAGGLSRRQIGEITGLSYTRLATYDNDPAFKELIAQYQPEADAQHEEQINEFIALEFESAMSAARIKNRKLVEIDEALEAGEEVETPSLTTLLAVTGDFGDRFGYAKQSRQTNEVLDFAKILEVQMAKMGKATVIDSTAQVLEEKKPSPPNQYASGSGLRRRI